ncbi:MAG: Mobile element protein [Anaerolineae bacterium]|nr:MAG: Mobile element protein [Anaerolineae bacterium]
MSKLNLDGPHVINKRGGESIAYQKRKKSKTTNLLPITDANSFIIASTGLVAGNHNDASNLKPYLQAAFGWMKQQGLSIRGASFNANSAFDAHEARKTCFNHGLKPNIPENKRGREWIFYPEVYKHRVASARSFAWIDKFRALLVRFDRRDLYCLNAHCLAFPMINIRYGIPEKRLNHFFNVIITIYLDNVNPFCRNYKNLSAEFYVPLRTIAIYEVLLPGGFFFSARLKTGDERTFQDNLDIDGISTQISR